MATREKTLEMSHATLKAQMRAASRRYARRRATGLVAKAVHYDAPRHRIVVDLANGVTFQFPPALLPELRRANAETLADVAVDPMGVGIRWERLDADYELTSVIRTLVGSAWAMRQLAAVGGSVRSARKARSSRANGAKGGRPRGRAART